MDLVIFMIHLCTIATLMFVQNNTSQKILFIAARTIQFPGVVFKVCIYLIVAIVISSLYFDVKSTHTLSKIYISNHVHRVRTLINFSNSISRSSAIAFHPAFSFSLIWNEFLPNNTTSFNLLIQSLSIPVIKRNAHLTFHWVGGFQFWFDFLW